MPQEICFRVKKGLPFPCWSLIKVLLKSAMARAARNNRVTICHFLWMGNHLHMMVIVHDPNDCKLFYGELQKKLTDYVKRLLGLDHLDLWEGRPQVATILDRAKAMERIAYYYLNPARAGLVETISEYPGLSSWEIFKGCESLKSQVSEQIPFIRCPSISPLRSEAISPSLDTRLAETLKEESKEIEELVVRPNAWAACYGLSDKELAVSNEAIVSVISKGELELSTARKRERKTVLGASRLRSEPGWPRRPRPRGWS